MQGLTGVPTTIPTFVIDLSDAFYGVTNFISVFIFIVLFI
jgi:hypothetical protein